MPGGPNWTREEVILALDLYFREGKAQLAKDHPKILALSQTLNDLPIHPLARRSPQFRNPAGVSMKLGNFLALDPDYGGTGLSRGSRLEREIWDEFAGEPAKLHQAAAQIREEYADASSPPEPTTNISYVSTTAKPAAQSSPVIERAPGIHDWWASEPGERFWLEVTNRSDLGENLKAPRYNESGRPFWSYSLVTHVRAGDVVFHYDKSREVPAIVAVSRATGDIWYDQLVWAARGTYARNANIEPHTRPGFYAGLERFQWLSEPVTLDDIRAETKTLREQQESFMERHGAPLYFPFELGAKRPARPLQGYLFRLPASFVALFQGLREVPDTLQAPAGEPADHSIGTQYRRPDETTTVGVAEPFSIDPAIVERGTRAHAETQNKLADYLQASGLEPLSPTPKEPAYDLAWKVRDALWIAEVKSLTTYNEEKQLRLGLGQLLRYRHQLTLAGHGDVRAVLFVERAPTDSSWLDLCGSLNVVLTWPAALKRLDSKLSEDIG